mgnify:CR=1 FL=1
MSITISHGFLKEPFLKIVKVRKRKKVRFHPKKVRFHPYRNIDFDGSKLCQSKFKHKYNLFGMFTTGTMIFSKWVKSHFFWVKSHFFSFPHLNYLEF